MSITIFITSVKLLHEILLSRDIYFLNVFRLNDGISSGRPTKSQANKAL